MAYSDGEKAEALIRLALNKYDFEKTATQVGIPSRTLRRWDADKNVTKKSVSGLLDRALEHLLMNVPEKMSPYEWGVALGILLDKWLIIRGEPTMRTETIQRQISSLTDDEFEDVLAEASEILRQRGGSGANSGSRDAPPGTGAPPTD